MFLDKGYETSMFHGLSTSGKTEILVNWVVNLKSDQEVHVSSGKSLNWHLLSAVAFSTAPRRHKLSV